jgi:hypothetical protein
MLAKELQTYLRSLNGGWMDLEATVDTFKSGDPEAEIAGIAVSWMSTREALERAQALGCSVFVTHEPTYYTHHDDLGSPVLALEGGQREARLRGGERASRSCVATTSGTRYVRSGSPTPGARRSDWARRVAGAGYYRVYDVAGRTAGDVARQVVERTRPFGQEAVQLIGDPDVPVHRVAIGTGAITPLFRIPSRVRRRYRSPD